MLERICGQGTAQIGDAKQHHLLQSTCHLPQVSSSMFQALMCPCHVYETPRDVSSECRNKERGRLVVMCHFFPLCLHATLFTKPTPCCSHFEFRVSFHALYLTTLLFGPAYAFPTVLFLRVG